MANNGTHRDEPVINEAYFRVEWQTRCCLLGNTDAFRFLCLLFEARGRPLSYAEIGEQCLCDPSVPAVNVRSLKRRVVAKLRAGGMPALAAAIRGAKEHYWLTLPVCPGPPVSLNA